MSTLFLIISQEATGRRIHHLEVEETVIGRSADCTIQLVHSLVSRRHTQITRCHRRFRIRDLNSRNGTYLNGEKITGEEVLADQSVIKIGPYCLTACFHFADAVKNVTADEASTQANEVCAVDASHPFWRPDVLTEGQLRVYTLLVNGMIEKEVAAHLGISINTVHDHAKAIYKKLAVSTRGELLALGARSQWTSSPEIIFKPAVKANGIP